MVYLTCNTEPWLAVQERLRRAKGVDRLVAVLRGDGSAAAMQRALLAVRLLTDREADRAAIMVRSCGVLALKESCTQGCLR